MFILANKKQLRRSLIVGEREYVRAKRGSLFTGGALAFAAIGTLVMYLFFADQASKTQDVLYMVIAFNAVAWFLILDHVLEIRFLKGLLNEQSLENIFDDEEWQKIQEAAQHQRVSDKEINELSSESGEETKKSEPDGEIDKSESDEETKKSESGEGINDSLSVK